MGATYSPREIDPVHPSKTEQLAMWINRVRSKKVMRRRNRKRDLRVEAVLTSALFKAEFELRTKQRLRNIKWQELKKELMLDYKYGSPNCSEEYSNYLRCHDHNPWKEPVCEELNSLNEFMTQLSEIKIPIER
ncbi:uncharacterized protein LOC117179716 [Belonocnema kinseyi]|uniref:uncharacterized protein LOC117179716 n=1 Tax=Belonocnema kinseyi TaxID=2817044 RepID=UPI00143DBE92|nr:uncharacterized protein LOC117179716 [Belonocnema kinseyi]